MLIDKLTNAIKRWLEISPAAIVKKAAEDTRSLEARLEALFEAIAAVRVDYDAALAAVKSNCDAALSVVAQDLQTLAGIGRDNTVAISEIRTTIDTLSRVIAACKEPGGLVLCSFCGLMKAKVSVRGKDVLCTTCLVAGY